jgi:hypothetical protein
MRPARIAAVVMFAAAIAVSGCSAHSTATHPAAVPQPSGAAPSLGPTPTKPQRGAASAMPRSTASQPGGRPATGRCAASALEGSVQDTDGAAGTIWSTIQLRNVSARTCTVKGIPEVRLLGAQGQPVTAPSQPGGPGGSLVVLRPGQAAHFAFSEPNACDTTVAGSRLRVTLPSGQGSVIVELGAKTEFGTCASVRVQALQGPPPRTAAPLADRVSDPQVAADRLVAAWLRGDRVAAGELAGRAATDRLFSESPPAQRPVALPCRPVAELAAFVCSYPLAEHAELSIFVQGGASAGYGVSGVEFGD